MNGKAYAVIIAGGKGERFWPLSTSKRPKQFLRIIGNKPLLAATVDRLKSVIPAQRIVVITNAAHVGMVRRVVPAVPAKNVVGEPFGRDTAAACALGTAIVKKQDPSGVVCVIPADHIIGNVRLFRQTLIEGIEVARRRKCIVTIGIRPTAPSTGYGYIEVGGKLNRKGHVVFRKAKRFVEKPDVKTAAKYLSSGRFYWNAGMFIWTVETFQRELKSFQPALFAMSEKILPLVGTSKIARVLAAEYRRIRKISVDYAVMEKSHNIVVARGSFDWDDIGAWSSLANHLDGDRDGNVIVGACELIDARDNIVVSGERLTALVGVSDLVVVQAKDTTLVCSRAKAQQVKKMVELLKAGGKYGRLM